MFGRVWTKSSVVSLDNWHSICMTWSNSMTEPKVYINGTKVELKPQSKGTALHPNCCSVAAGGTLTLAVAHNFVKNKISIETGTELKGSLSLFRVWKRARSAQDISTMACTDGDMLHWEKRIWNKAEDCKPIQDLTQKCAVFVLLFVIILREKFDCLAHLNVISNADVGEIQDELTEILAKRYKIDHYEIKTDANFIFIYTLDDLLPDLDTNPPLTATESLPHTTETQTTTIPQLTSTTTEIITTAQTTGTTPNQVAITTEVVSSSTETKKKSYFSVNVNVTINGSGDPENIITTWLHETLSGKGIHVLHFKLLTSSTHAQKRSVETESFKVERKVTTYTDIRETEKWIHGLLEKQYTSGAVLLQPEDILISYIDNAEDILIMIEDLIHENKNLDEYELSTVLNKLADVINVSVITPPLGEVIINITSDILESDSNLLPFTNRCIYINREPFSGTVAFISLPSEIQERFPIINNTSPRVQFQFYGVPTLFQTKDDPDGKRLNTYVVSASVTNATGCIENLKEYVAVTLHHLTSKNDVSRTPIDEKNEQILTLITYMGCGVSSCFLGITVLTYTLLEKLRRDYPSKILLNLSLALLGLNLVFLLNSWISSFGIYGLCIAVAVTLHYFLLTSFTWMGLGAVNMYFALVKVFNVYVPSYILKFCLLGWGIPLIICGLVVAIKRDAYGMNTMSDSQMTLDDSEMFCWVQNDVVFYVSVVSYIAFILLCNGSIFLVVLIQIRNMQVNQPAGTRSGILKDLRAVVSLTFLLGLTWSVAFLAWGPVKVFLLYLFSILNSLQGFFIFVFHCLMKENVRKQWRIHLCCGAFKLQECSEWSQTATVVPKHKPNPPNTFPFMASVRSIKSNSTQSSTVSLESNQHQMTITRPDLGFVYENSFVIPRARAGLMVLPYDTSPATASGLEFPSRPWKNGFDADIYPT
ncbi:hypothetical protein cypCar_00006904 [Cyprinus carpio]|nr:hypothetical protein cypCar_00006904 [Cyprinus carpio]